MVFNGSQCSVAGCIRKPASRGFCHGHYLRWRKGRKLERPHLGDVARRKVIAVADAVDRGKTSRAPSAPSTSGRQQVAEQRNGRVDGLLATDVTCQGVNQ
jgi:hypothetical protein